MSAESRAEGPEATQRSERSVAGNVAFGVGVVVVLAAMALGVYAAVALLGDAVDRAPLSDLVPEDGHIALIIGGIAVGAVTGLMVPVIVFGMFRKGEARAGAGAVARKLLAVLVFDVWLLLVAFAVAQLGWFLPQGLVNVIGVFAVGFSWMPLAMVPWEKLGLGDLPVNRRGKSASRQAE
ncbi:hypothetical protein [Streptomyces sp. S.PB5]|uniref:hypothetical protein n=1 Tax=Streptomyces sp. S.PB5 TaxID=3020844 RepID=UPI0025B021FA|nr:hypothetical protein [Streptomyces sp. S.PB5]MDN3028662.1 hypothetical protein [Streptomyces sp. S.PB5]